MDRVLVWVMAWSVSCAPTGPSAAGRPGSMATSPAPTGSDPATWWCIAFDDGENGRCMDGHAKCELFRGVLVSGEADLNEHISRCAPQQRVVCLDAQKAQDGTTDTLCYPNFATCRSYFDHRSSKNDRYVAITSGCRATPPGTPAASGASPDPDEATHWWCLDLAGGQYGSCHRSHRACETRRNFALHMQSMTPDQVSNCTPQRSAICLETQSVRDDEHYLKCQSTTPMCQAAVNYYKRKQDLIVSDCHSVD
jgi:hypothetical protein